MNNYIFPFDRIPKNSRVILYGAGSVGLCFYKQLTNTKYAAIVKWVDSKWEKFGDTDMPVASVESILLCEFDYIVIAIENPAVAYEVRKNLIELGVADDKIIHSEQYRFADSGLFETVREEAQAPAMMDEVVRINPKELLCAARLDLAVRYLVAKDIKNGVENEANLSLYSRMILTRTAAYEDKSYFSDTIREGTRDYLASMKKLSRSMQQKGFLKEEFVPVGKNKILLNGAHRTATAMALEEELWCKFYESRSGNENFGIRWFEENGFNTYDKIRVLRAYADLYDKCGIMLLFGTCLEQWEYLQAQLSGYMTVVGSFDLDYSDNYIAFENLFRDIYRDPLWRNVYIDRKVSLLKMAPLKIRVLLVSDEGHKESDLYSTMNSLKLELRDRLYFDTDIAPVVMHGSDSPEEFNLLKKIILSVNNLKHLDMRVARNYSEEFIERLERLKTTLADKQISTDDICISGSSGFEIFGLRKSNDLDFLSNPKVRKQYGDITFLWDEATDYVRKNSIRISDKNLYPDELLTEDDNFYYLFNGLKFVNIELIAAKKEYDKRENDILDVRLYQLFRDYSRNFSNKRYLKEQIEREFYNKR